MNADSAFVIGKRHEICQDYAQAEVENNLAYAFVSDGCSSSKNSDIGARLMVLSAKQNIQNLLDLGKPFYNKDVDDSGLVIISNAMVVAKMFNLPPEILDATLLSIVSDGKTISLSAFGDGVFVLMWENGHMRYVDIEFSNGYPDYLSYRINKDRQSKYDKLYQEGIVRINCNQAVQETRYLELHKAYVETFSYDSYYGKLVTVIALSDGVRSFYKRSQSNTNEPVPLKEVLNNLLDFKLYSGRFVQRRLNRFLKDVAQRGWEHYDDIAITAIHFGGTDDIRTAQ